MICPPCKAGGKAAQEGDQAAATAEHAACEGGCECQHITVSVLRTH